jgi:type I restriction enzyme S subunit
MELKEGYKDTEVGVIPEDWEVKRLDQVSRFSNGKAHEQVIDRNGEFIVVNSKFISTEGVVFKNSNIAIAPLLRGDITMVMSDIPNGKALAKCFLIERDNIYTLNQRICSIKTEICDNNFLFYILNRNKYFLSFDSGSGQTNLRRREILDCPLAIPPTIAEQQAIAEVLSDTDNLIQALEKQIAKKRNIKQGAMQTLLQPKEGWEMKKLGEIADITKLAGFEYTKYFNSYNNGGEIIVVRGTNITQNKMNLADVKYIPRATSNFLQRSKLKKNDLVFAYVGTIGPIYLIDENDKYHLGPNTSKITSGIELYPPFLYHYFTSNLIKKEIIDNTSIGAQPSLSMFKIRSFKIILPPKEEQRSIATILSDMDVEINILETKLNKHKLLKLSMMQNILTGKIRLIKS